MEAPGQDELGPGGTTVGTRPAAWQLPAGPPWGTLEL